MLGKLLKYDLKFVFKHLSIFYVIMFLAVALGRFFGMFDNSTVMIVISNIFMGIMIAMIFNIVINNAIRLWVRMISNVYKDESYLTHTLPVSKNEIYLSKVITAFVSVIVSLIVIVVGLGLWFGSDAIKGFLEMVIDGALSTKVLLLMITVLILEMFFLIMVGFLGIIIGYKFNYRKTILSIIFSVFIYGAFNICSFIILCGWALFNNEVLELFKTNAIPSVDLVYDILLLASIIYLGYSIISGFISVKLLNKGVNVD